MSRIRALWLSAVAVVALGLLSRCGSEKAKDEDSDEGTPPETPTGEVPDDWDGLSDWNDSAFEVIEE